MGSKGIQQRDKRPSRFNPTATLLNVTANGEDDAVYDVSSGKMISTLRDTKYARFTNDGTLLIGGNYRHLIVWSTKDWTVVRDLPNGPDYGNRIAIFPESDLVVIGGGKSARLLR